MSSRVDKRLQELQGDRIWRQKDHGLQADTTTHLQCTQTNGTCGSLVQRHAWGLKLEVWSRKRNNRERFRSVNRFGVVRFRTEDSGELHTNYMPWLPKLESEINNRLGYVMAIV